MCNDLLDEGVMCQFDYKKLKAMVDTFISLIALMQYKLGSSASIKITSSYEMKFSMYTKPTKSGIETFVLSKYDTKEKMIECISLYSDAYNKLTKLEQEIFSKSFFNKEIQDIYCAQYKRDLYPRELSKIRKSAVIKFCIQLNFNEMDYDYILKGGGAY